MDHKGTLLVVDDNPVNLMLLAGALKADDYQVLPADSGEMALPSVSACLPELILLGKRLNFAHTRPRGAHHPLPGRQRKHIRASPSMGL